MNNKEFIQKRGLNCRKFILTNDKIIIETTTYRKIDKYEVKLDRLGFDIHYQSDNTLPGKILFVFTLIWFVGSILSIIFAGKDNTGFWIFSAIGSAFFSVFNFLRQHQDDIFLVGGGTNIVFYRDIPNERLVLEFIDQVNLRQKHLLREKYTPVENYSNEDDYIQTLKWLCDKGAISNVELNEYQTKFKTHKLL
jgi:hypothetical protein